MGFQSSSLSYLNALYALYSPLLTSGRYLENSAYGSRSPVLPIKYFAATSSSTFEVLVGSSSLSIAAVYPPDPPTGLSKPSPPLIAAPDAAPNKATSPGLYLRFVYLPSFIPTPLRLVPSAEINPFSNAASYFFLLAAV